MRMEDFFWYLIYDEIKFVAMESRDLLWVEFMVH